MKPIVFAGPSLFGVAAARLGGVTLRPPAGCGDILEALKRGAKTIGLVDGLFETEPSVWHKEILAGLDGGARVYGAASLGALRAAECDRFGMVGLGAIYDDYRSGRRVADADVAVVHSPREMGYAPLSVALVDVEATLARLRAMEAINPADAGILRTAAATMFFKERTWSALVQRCAKTTRSGEHLIALLEKNATSQKTIDALHLVDTLAELVETSVVASPRLPEALSRTGFLAALEARVERRLARPAQA